MKTLQLPKSRYFMAAAAFLLIAAITGTILCLPGKNRTREAAGTSDPDGNTASKDSWSVVMQNGIGIQPTLFDSAGVDPGSGFKITSEEDIDPSLLQSALAVKPKQDYSLNRLSKNEFLLQFSKSLTPDSIYQFILTTEKDSQPYSWAFQTKKAFRVVRTLPRNEGAGVPVNSGIEITFSHEGMEKLDGFFEISPAVKGSFEYHKKTAVFVPEGLQYNTIYTVTVKKGLGLAGSTEKLTEDTIFRFQTQASSTGSKTSDPYLNFSQAVYNFTTREIPNLRLYSDDYFKNSEFTVEIYKYRSSADFTKDLAKYDELPPWAIHSSKDLRFDKTGLDRHTTFKTGIYNAGGPWYDQFLVFPDKLEEGHYLVSVVSGKYEFSTHMQVNDLSVYIMHGHEKSLVWTNDSKTGQPVPGVQVESRGLRTVQTGSDGVACLEAAPGGGSNNLSGDSLNNSSEGSANNSSGDSPSNSSAAGLDPGGRVSDAGTRYFILKATGRPDFIARLEAGFYYGYYDSNYYRGASGNPAMRYWSYLYLDRDMYLPDDTIRVWGVAKPREAGKSILHVVVQLVKYTYDSYSSKESVLQSKEVPLSPYGTYTAELEYENFNPGTYYLIVRAGEDLLEQRYVDISKYTKPAYKIDVSADKEACFLGETVNLDVHANFFEGSPVSGLQLDYHTYHYDATKLKSPDGRLECGKDGQTSLSYVPRLENSAVPVDWQPVWVNFLFANAMAEEQQVQAAHTLQVFPSNVMIESSGKINDGKVHISIATNSIDLEKYKQRKEYDYSVESYRGAPLDRKLKVRMYESYWDRKETGQYYDFINKVSRKRYEYFEVKNLLREFECETAGGKFETEYPFQDFSYRKSYYMEIAGTDTNNTPLKTTQYMYYHNLYPSYLEQVEFTKEYTLKEENGKTRLKTGEKASIKVLENNKDFDMPENGRVLYMTLKNGLAGYAIKAGRNYDAPFEESLIPNAYLKAVYFDGENIYGAGGYGLNYDYSERELTISLEPNKQQYRPGDTAAMKVRVTDRQGNPCRAQVNISIVDEAFFALRNQSVDTAASLYGYVFGTGIINDYLSYSPAQLRNPAAECGEGGGAGLIRQDFKDNAFFGTVDTGPDGKGSVSFKLPHNLTSWRVTCQGITGDLKAGNTKININTKLPFFTTVIFNDIYLEGDSPGISLRSYGSKVKGADPVKYEVAIERADGYRKTFEKEQAAGSYCNMKLESLAAGDYTVTVSAKSGDYTDAICKSFKVVKNILETGRTAYFTLADGVDLSSGLDISAENSLVQLTFYNRSLTRYFRALNSVFYSWGERVDQKLSRKIAGEYLKKYFDITYADPEEIDLKAYQTPDGGIALLTYDSSDPALTAKICSLAADSFDRVDLETYFSMILQNAESTGEDIASAYWGLAGLGKPVLLDIRAYLKQQDISLKERLCLGIALTELGDYPGAQAVYDEVTAKHGKAAGNYLYIDTGPDGDDIVEATSLMSLIALKINVPDKEKLFDYVLDHSTDDILLNLEKLIYLSSSVPKADKGGSAVIHLDGRKENIKLEGDRRHSMVMTYEKLKQLKITDVEGDIEAAVKYTGPLSMLSDESSSLATLTRTYQIKSRPSGQPGLFSPSDIVEIVLDVQLDHAAPDGYYQVTDVLPSGFRYMPPRDWSSEQWHWGSVDGQKVTFGCYMSSSGPRHTSIKYLARVTAPGVYTADSAVIKHVKGQFYSFAKRQRIEIE